MPSAIDIKNYANEKPNAFVSPFSDKPPIALYSSIAIKGTNDNDCLPCSITSLNRKKLYRFLIQLAEEKIILPQNSSSFTTSTPTIPDLPSGSFDSIEVYLDAFVNNFGLSRQITWERFDFISAPLIWTLNTVPGNAISISNMIITTTDPQVTINWGDGSTPVTVNSGSPVSKSYT